MKGFICSQFEVWAEILLLVLIRLLFPSLLLLCVCAYSFLPQFESCCLCHLTLGFDIKQQHHCNASPSLLVIPTLVPAYGLTENWDFFFLFSFFLLYSSSVRKNLLLRLHLSNILCRWIATCICITFVIVFETDTKYPLNNFDSIFSATRS